MQLLQNFKLYPTSSFNIPLETVKEILFELKKTFFISTSIYENKKREENSELDLDSDEESKYKNKNKKKIKKSQSPLSEEKLIENYIKSNYSSVTEKLCENILRGMSSILNDQKLFELFNYNDTQMMDQVIYSSNDKDNKDCLAYIFFKTFQEQIISHPYYSEIAQNSGSNDLSEISQLISENYDENILYILLINQFNQLIIYFPKIFTDVGGINLYEFEHFLISVLRCKIQKFNNDNIKILEFNYNYVISLLNIIDTLHLRLFNNNVEFKENINEYVEIRNRMITMLFYIMSISFSNEKEKAYNSFLYLIKGKALGLFLDIYMVTTHDKLQVRELQYELIPNLMSIFYIFVRNNFIRFLWDDYKENEIELNNESDSEDAEEEKQEKIKKEKSKTKSNKTVEIFLSSYKLQTFVLKIFAEKFSRLLLINFKTFLNEPLCLLYFETFFLLPQSSIIQQITDYTIEVLMTKEINQYKKYLEEKNNKEKNNSKNNNVNSDEGKIFLILYYMNKIVLRIFNNDSQLFNDENNPKPFEITYEEKLDMCQRYLNTYIKILKKLKPKYSKEIGLIEKDKIPYENFILNGIAFALDKSEVINGYICLENVYFLDFVKMYIKNGLFVDEEIIHDIIITYIKLAKKWEITENMNLIHIKFMEKFKSYILNKGHMKIVENKSSKDKEEENNDDEEKEKEEKEEKEEEIVEEENSSNEKSKKEKSEKKKKNGGKRKKRTYNEVIKEEDEENEINKKVKKKKKEK